jgi:hypothetical protein
MADTFTQVTTQGYGSRLGNSLKGIIFGALFFFGSFLLLWWNEGNLAREKVAFKEMERAVVPASGDKVDPALAGKLVHISADLSAPESIGDSEFLAAGPYLVLERQVEMYQWVEKEESETKEKVGGSSETRTTYTYTKEWKRGRENSSSFKHPEGHTNPVPRYSDATFRASNTSFGAYKGDDIVERLSGTEELSINQEQVLSSQVLASGGYLNLPVSPGAASPQVGDLRISYSVVRPGRFSIMAVQSSDARFTVFTASNGKEKFLIEAGNKSAAQLVASARDAAGTLAWILRGVGAFIMWIGLMVMLNPLATLLSILPPLAKIGRGAIGLFALALAAILSSLTIIVSMIAHNPIMLAAVITLGIAGIVLWLKKKAKGISIPTAAIPAMPPPPPVR